MKLRRALKSAALGVVFVGVPASVIFCFIQYRRTTALIRDGVFPPYMLDLFWETFVPTTFVLFLLASAVLGAVVGVARHLATREPAV